MISVHQIFPTKIPQKTNIFQLFDFWFRFNVIFVYKTENVSEIFEKYFNCEWKRFENQYKFELDITCIESTPFIELELTSEFI